MKLDARTILILSHPDRTKVLLLRRISTKKLFPNLITGIGGKIEFDLGEHNDIEKAMLREFHEETKIPLDEITNIHLRLSTITYRESFDGAVVLFWFTGDLIQIPNDLSCTEGTLHFFDKTNLPESEMIPSARQAIKFVVSLAPDDTMKYIGWFDDDKIILITNKD